MELSKRIHAFKILGSLFSDIVNNPQNHSDFFEFAQIANNKNPWFTKRNIISSIKGLAVMLEGDKLEKWIYTYKLQNNSSKKVAVIMAGNIPLVGFHDLLSVLITGNYLIAKTSSKDSVLIKYVLEKLAEIEPEFSDLYEICTERLPKFDAIISTGSNNSSRYFEYYFGKYPHIIRKNRNSVAVLTNEDSPEDIKKIGSDIFDYFGLGCRNVSKLYIPENYDMVAFLDNLQNFDYLQEHTKFMNNYEYNRSIYLLSQEKHFDTGYACFKEDFNLSSPLAVVFYEKYSNIELVAQNLEKQAEQIQCVVSNKNIFFKKNVLPGISQTPELSDYADDIDTIDFLIKLS